MKLVSKWLLLALLAIPAVALAASWWNNDWKYRKEIGFDLSPTGANVAGTPIDVPVLVRLSLANFSYFNDAKPDGSDFRLIASDDKTPLKFHFEKYDQQNQMALLWIRMPQLTGGSKTDKIYAYYGNPNAASAADVPGTYDTNQVLVLSFGETSGLPQDSTAYKNNSTTSTAELVPAALIGGGAKFSGKESIVVPASPSLRLLPNQGLTASAWVRIEQAQQAVIFALTEKDNAVEAAVDGSKLVANLRLGGHTVSVTQPADLELGKWHHVAITLGAGKATLYVDGAAVGSAPVDLQEVGGEFRVGSGPNDSQFLVGQVDQVEVAKVARTADFIKATVGSQAMDGNLVLFGADGQREGGGQTSYFVTIAKNLTLDGWVVIGICMGMLVIALLVMVMKAVTLSKVERANGRFMKDFSTAKDLTSLFREEGDKEDPRFAASTLHGLYHDGVAELNKRIAGVSVGAQRAALLSPQSIDAIRAAMDASMTRIQQRLSSRMVLLTIAISGGPFLGLLGTVIGVMITFAAIALSGDVNVNAIAPGTAAALAATVAGLSVAIPALFGYNWLNTRIKAINADNRVFVDEYIARLAEQYS